MAIETLPATRQRRESLVAQHLGNIMQAVRDLSGSAVPVPVAAGIVSRYARAVFGFPLIADSAALVALLLRPEAKGLEVEELDLLVGLFAAGGPWPA